MGLRVRALDVRVLGFRVLGFRVYGSGFRVWGTWDFGFVVLRIQGLGASGFESRGHGA